jgi:cell division septum initiation protein DivIVA
MPRKPKEPAEEKPVLTPEQESAKKLLKRIRERYKIMVEADRENRLAAIADMKFLRVVGAQWDKTVKNERGDRPSYEFNKLAVKADRIINDMRANRPQGKVRGTEDGDKDTADILEGLCRNIFANSDGDTICDYAGEYQVGGGMGAWRIDTEYADDSFDQDIKLSPIKNPLCLYCDPAAADPIKRDAEDWILTERIANAAHESKYKDRKKVSFEESEFDDEGDWRDEETTRICEYWWKEYVNKELWLLPDGKVIDSTSDEAALLDPTQIPGPDDRKRRRTVRAPKIMMCIASGEAILEGPIECAGTQHRFVMVFGKWVVIDGKVIWYGLTRHAKDAQRRYNVSQTAVTETIATAPKSFFWVTDKNAAGHLDKWAVAHKEAMPFLTFTPDPLNGNAAPQRMGGQEVPVALIQESVMANQDLKDVTGVYDASLGEKSNESSGRAISRRAEQSDIINLIFPDNMAKGIKRTWEIMLDLIPHVYDTERTIRVLGVDGAEKFVKVNSFVVDEASGEQKAVNDLRRGKFDVTVTTGPSFATQRQEASELYVQLLQAIPALGAVAPDLVVKTFDTPYSEDMAERLRMMLPPQIQQSLNKDKPIPPEAQAALQQAQQAMQIVGEQSKLVEAAAAELEQSKAQGQAETDKQKAELDTKIANLKTEEARFEAQMAKETARIAQLEAKLAEKTATSGGDEERAALSDQLSQAVDGLRQMVTEFTQQSLQIIADIQTRSQPQVIVAPKPRIVGAKREGGMLKIIYEDSPETVQ